ncbi:MAG TPA: hypothetical protein VG820_11605 [Fimbriimonadaceae bacterium]|nr:hypothetical protein [Fimbriimonadaceae bacterium]
MKSNTRRKVLWAFGILAVLCPGSLCGVGYFVVRSYFIGPAEQLPKELSMAKAEGIPLEPDDLRHKPPVPDDQNAATVYSAFFPHLDRAGGKARGGKDPLQAFLAGKATPEQAAEIRRMLAGSKESLDEIVAATARPFCDFHSHYEDGLRVTFPQFGQFRTAIRLLAARAEDLAAQGRVGEAYAVLAKADRMARHAGQEPILLAKLVEVSLHAIVLTEFDHLLERSADHPELLKRAQQTLDGFGALPDLRPAFGGELVMGRIMVHQIHTVGDLRALNDSASGSGDGREAGSGPSLPDWVTKGIEAKVVSRWRRTIEALPTDPAEWEKAFRVLQDADKAIQSDTSVSGKLNSVFFPVFFQSALAIGHLDADRHVAATSIRLLQDRLAKGSLPATLPNYGAVSVDPFDGKPLRYRRTPDGFTIYSVDRDRADNGGVPQKSGSPGDLIRSFKVAPRR